MTVDGERAAQSQLWKRTLAKTASLSSFTLALLVGRWELVVVATVAGTVTFLGFFLELGSAA